MRGARLGAAYLAGVIMIDHSYESLVKFLDYEAEKGLVNRNTIASRKGAASKMLGILSDEERADLRGLDLEDVSKKFANLEGSRYTSDSLQVYRSRVGKALDEFLRYKENPAGFRVAQSSRAGKARAPKRDEGAPGRRGLSEKADVQTMAGQTNAAASASIDFPIPLRPGVIVTIRNLPVDLTEREAQKIAGVITALSTHQQGLLPFQKEDS